MLELTSHDFGRLAVKTPSYNIYETYLWSGHVEKHVLSPFWGVCFQRVAAWEKRICMYSAARDVTWIAMGIP